MFGQRGIRESIPRNGRPRGNLHPLPGPQCPLLHDEGLNSLAVLPVRGAAGAAWACHGSRSARLGSDAAEQHSVGVPPGS